MTINTKRHIHDDVWYYQGGNILRGRIIRINIEIKPAMQTGIPFKVKELYTVNKYYNKILQGDEETLYLHEMYSNMQEVLQIVADRYDGG